MKPLNSNCKITLKIIEAKYLKDADTFGKQDPMIKFKFLGREFKTTVKDDAGKHAILNESFELEDMEKGSFENLILETYDEDAGGVLDFIGASQPI